MKKRKLIKKNKKKKGFTLIELLAVILILGIIALIAVPTVNNVIKEARENAAKQTITNYVKAVEQQILLNKIDADTSNDINDGKYFVADLAALGVSIQGKAPESGYIIVMNDEVYYLYLNTADYTIFMNDKGEYFVEQYINNIATTTDCFNIDIDSLESRNSKWLPITASVVTGKKYRFRGHVEFTFSDKLASKGASDFILQSPLMPGKYALFYRKYNLEKSIEIDFDVTSEATKDLTDVCAIYVDTTNLKGKVSLTNFTIEEVND